MELDPSLSLTAEGLWSDEESIDDQLSDENDEQDASKPRRKVVSSCSSSYRRVAAQNMKCLQPHK